MVRDITITAKECQCEKCGHEWVHIGDGTPKNCAYKPCRSREWNGKKKHVQSHTNEIKFPAPRKGGRPKTITLFDREE